MKKQYSLPFLIGTLVVGLVVGALGVSMSNGSLLAGDLGRTTMGGNPNTIPTTKPNEKNNPGFGVSIDGNSNNTPTSQSNVPVLTGVGLACNTNACDLNKKIDALYALIQLHHQCELEQQANYATSPDGKLTSDPKSSVVKIGTGSSPCDALSVNKDKLLSFLKANDHFFALDK